MFEKYLLFLVLILLCFKFIESCSECNKPYEPPGNIKFPYGDEGQMNTDVAENDTNTVTCSDVGILIRSLYGRCPFPPEDPEDMKLTNPYVECPDFPELIPPVTLIMGESLPQPSVQCQNCDLKLTQDSTAVLLKCIGCYDLPSPDHKANYTEKDLLYKVFFVEIANYTSVNVQGTENFQ